MPIYMGIFEKPHVLDRKFRGDVKAKGYEGWIQLQSAQLGATSTPHRPRPQARGVDAGHPGHRDRRASRTRSRPLSPGKLSHGKGILIVIAFVKADGTTHLTLVLQNTLIGSYSISGTATSPTRG